MLGGGQSSTSWLHDSSVHTSRPTCTCLSVPLCRTISGWIPPSLQTYPTPHRQIHSLRSCQPAVRHGTAVDNLQGLQGMMSYAIQSFTLGPSSLAIKFCHCPLKTPTASSRSPQPSTRHHHDSETLSLQAMDRHTVQVIGTLTAPASCTCVPAGSKYSRYCEPK